MKIQAFALERLLSVWENRVEINLSESGLHPLRPSEFLSQATWEKFFHLPLGYTQADGLPELRQAIAALYPGASPKNILVTNGSSEANFILAWSFLEPGNEIIMMMPNYLQIWGIARTFQVTVKEFYLQPENNWRPDLEKLAELMTVRTKLISVCHPNNPTGMVFTPEEMERIISLAQANQIWLHSDEVYRGAELMDKETPSFWGKYERVIVTAGLSKAYALAGLRLGWIVAPETIISKTWEAHDYTCITAGTLSNHLALIALQPQIREKILRRSRKILQKNLQVLTSWVEEHSDVLDFIPPQAGGVAFLHYNLPLNSTRLVEQLRDEKSVLVVPGDSFGLDHFFRLGIGLETSVLEEGLHRIGEFILQKRQKKGEG